jgi:hypothetical protein
MNGFSFSSIGAKILIGAIAVNISLGALNLALRKWPDVLKGKTSFPVLSGVGVNGEEWKAGDKPCHVLRVTRDDCPYCAKDKPKYDAFLDAARQANCEIVEIAPQAGGMAANPRPGVTQLKFVDNALGSTVYPFVTPQTVVLDGQWNVRWQRRGIFSDDSLVRGISVLGTIARQGK